MEHNKCTEQTFVLLKPDALKRGLAGRIISRFEEAGLTLAAMKFQMVSRALAEEHYAEHRGKPFFQPLSDFLCSGPVIAMAWQGAHAVSVVRKIIGATEPLKAEPGTIRGSFCHMSYERSRETLGVIPNLVHASDSRENAGKELSLWFAPGELSGSWKRYDAECF